MYLRWSEYMKSELNMFLVSPYGPALGSEVQKNPASIAALVKIVNVVTRTTITWRCIIMKNIKSIF
jgi:hypothetical protein